MLHRLSLVVPGLCGPLPDIEAVEAAALPLLDLLGSLRREKSGAADHPAQLAQLFGLDAGRVLADAAICLLSYGIEPGEGCWMHADPVNLQADMDRALLSDAQILAIRETEAETLVAQINTHFAEDGLALVMADADNWFIEQQDCDLATTPLGRAVGRNVNHLLPSGGGAAQWRRFLNEAQMLLHISEVNQQREQRGQPAINSLWLWGEGSLPPAGDSDITQVYADDALTAGLAKLNRIEPAALTDPIAVTHAMKHDGHALVSLNQLHGPCNYGDTPAWLDAMLALVEDWLEPLIATARSLDVDADIYPCNGVRYHLDHKKRFNISRLIFRKKQRLQDHVETQ